MKRQAFASFIAIFLIAPILSPVAAVDDELPSAVGHYQVLINDQPTRTIDFSARRERDGSTAGEMVFEEIGSRPESKANVEADADGATGSFSLKADFDCLMVKGNSAVMSGNITQASVRRYVGRRVLLVVQDNGHGVGPERDKLTWGFYQASAANFRLLTDFERPDEQAGVSWVATDAERADDTGTLSNQSEEIRCQSFPLSAFSFIDAKAGHGKIQVKSGMSQ